MEKRDKKITIRDIAALAGVSIATVSYVLNGKSQRYSPETLERIRRVMRESGYEPDFTARSLARGKTRLLGLILPLSGGHARSSALLRDNPFYTELADGIMEVASEKKYDLIISGMESGDEAITWIRRRKPDGLIYLGFFPESEEADLKRIGLPVVLIDSEPGIAAGYFHVRTDEAQAGYDAVAALISHGHRRIALVSGPTANSRINSLRRSAWEKALLDAGLSIDKKLIFEQPVSFEGGYLAARDMLAADLPCTAVFCVADIMAFGLIRSLNVAGVDVPGRLSVIGFDDIGLCRYFVPALSTVRQDIALKGREAARLLIGAIEGSGETGDTLYIPHSLQLRDTIRRIEG